MLKFKLIVLVATVALIASCDNGYKTIPYPEIGEHGEDGKGFVKEYNANGKRVLVYGSYHTNDSTDKEVADIVQQLEDFRPDIILYEGDYIESSETLNESVHEYFEMGLVRWWAKQHQIKDLNIEPPAREKHAYLQGKYPTEKLLLVSILGQNIMFIVNNTKEDFEAAYAGFIKDLEREGMRLSTERKTIAYFYKMYEAYYGKPFEPKTFDYETIELKYNKTDLNKINQDAARYRDQYMLKTIAATLKQYNRVYVQVGKYHALAWQPAIEKIVKQKD